MKIAFYSLALSVSFLLPARADLTIVQKVEGVGPATDMTIKIKGDKARVEASPQLTTIVDGKSGEVINLINDEKTVVRISPDKMKAVTDMIKKFNDLAGFSVHDRRELWRGFDTRLIAFDLDGHIRSRPDSFNLLHNREVGTGRKQEGNAQRQRIECDFHMAK